MNREYYLNILDKIDSARDVIDLRGLFLIVCNDMDYDKSMGDIDDIEQQLYMMMHDYNDSNADMNRQWSLMFELKRKWLEFDPNAFL